MKFLFTILYAGIAFLIVGIVIVSYARFMQYYHDHHKKQ